MERFTGNAANNCSWFTVDSGFPVQGQMESAVSQHCLWQNFRHWEHWKAGLNTASGIKRGKTARTHDSFPTELTILEQGNHCWGEAVDILLCHFKWPSCEKKTDSMWGDRESARKGSGRCGGKWGPNVSLDQAMGFLSRSGVVMGSHSRDRIWFHCWVDACVSRYWVIPTIAVICYWLSMSVVGQEQRHFYLGWESFIHSMIKPELFTNRVPNGLHNKWDIKSGILGLGRS